MPRRGHCVIHHAIHHAIPALIALCNPPCNAQEHRALELNRAEFGEVMRRIIAADEVRLRVRPGGSRHHVITTGQTLNVRK